MSEVKTEFEYVLKRPIQYANKGAQHEASFVRLTAPTSRNSRECATLKQAFWRAADRGEKGESDGDPDITGQDVMILIAMSRDVDLADVMEVARSLFTKGKVATVDGETPLTKPLIDEMDQEDVEAMLGEYLVNFTLASSLAQMKTKSSKESSP